MGASTADEARARALQVPSPAGPRSRPGRLWRLAGAPAARPDRDARRLVAGQALVRVSVTQGVALQA